MTEADMVMDCFQKLKLQNKYREIVLEVPYLSRCIDMILVEDNFELISIEFKLKNWRRAIQQARDHKIGCNRSYICLPKPKNDVISAELTEELSNSGIGLLLYHPNSSNPLEERIPAVTYNNKWPPYVESLRNVINLVAEKQVFIV